MFHARILQLQERIFWEPLGGFGMCSLNHIIAKAFLSANAFQ